MSGTVATVRVDFIVGTRVIVLPDDPARGADSGSVVGHAFAYSEHGDPVFHYLIQLESPCDDGRGPVYPIVAAQWGEVRSHPDDVNALIHGV